MTRRRVPTLPMAKVEGNLARAVCPNLFADVREFHEKFGLAPSSKKHALDLSTQIFRIRFMFEELLEYCRAVGYVPVVAEDGAVEIVPAENDFNAAQAFDGLIDLSYVALGTAYLHGFPFDAGWRRVHQANMRKVRATQSAQSKRGSTQDVVKPPGWKAPDLEDLCS